MAAAIKCRYCHSDLSAPDLGASDIREQILADFDTQASAMMNEVFGAAPESDIPVQLAVTDLTLTRFDEAGSGTIVEVSGQVANTSNAMCMARLEVSFLSPHGAHLGDGVTDVQGIRAWETRGWSARWGTDAGAWVALASEVTVVPLPMAVEHDPDALNRLAMFESSLGTPTVPLSKWRGRKFKTKSASLAARCQSCGYRYRAAGAALNYLAYQQGTLSRLARGYNSFEEATNVTRDKDQNRRIAAGNEGDRLRSELADANAEISCPACGSQDVLIESPSR